MVFADLSSGHFVIWNLVGCVAQW